ncbi:hypothetical protein L208DRAFT_1409563 [Tricholoma matsutake]|nr:hypothetical protein L208DRAFT_1409563 [Tricholoma matsutake 945]
MTTTKRPTVTHTLIPTLRRVSKHPQQNMPRHLRPGPVHPHLQSIAVLIEPLPRSLAISAKPSY